LPDRDEGDEEYRLPPVCCASRTISTIADGKANFVARADLYDPSSNTWAVTGALSQARSAHTLIELLNGQALAAGGFTKNSTGSTFLTSAELYTP
jgi:hypothetical protein